MILKELLERLSAVGIDHCSEKEIRKQLRITKNVKTASSQYFLQRGCKETQIVRGITPVRAVSCIQVPQCSIPAAFFTILEESKFEGCLIMIKILLFILSACMYTKESIAPIHIITSERKEADNAQQSGNVTATISQGMHDFLLQSHYNHFSNFCVFPLHQQSLLSDLGSSPLPQLCLGAFHHLSNACVLDVHSSSHQ